MKFVNASFSLKFQPQQSIRRKFPDIETELKDFYGAAQLMPIPDNFAPEAPRIVLDSLNGHSKISFSVIAATFSVNFDNDYASNFDLTKKYILERVKLLIDSIKKIGINQFYYFGLSYNLNLDTNGKSPVDFLTDMFPKNGISEQTNLYEEFHSYSEVLNSVYFLNTQISTFKNFSTKGNSIPDLLDLKSSKIVEEGVNVFLDVNTRYRYLNSGDSYDISIADKELIEILNVLEKKILTWEK